MNTLTAAVPPCEVGTLTVTILLLAGTDSLVVTTFPPTDVPVIWKVCPLDDVMVVSEPAAVPTRKTTGKVLRVLRLKQNPKATISSLFTANSRGLMDVARFDDITGQIQTERWRLYLVYFDPASPRWRMTAGSSCSAGM